MIPVTDIRARESFCFMRWSKSSWGFFRWVSCSLFFISYQPFHSPCSCISRSPGSAERACGASPWQRWPPCWCPAPLLGQWQRCCSWRLCCQSSSTTTCWKLSGKKKRESNMPSISKWGNTVIDARRRESCSLGGYESPWAPGGAIFIPEWGSWWTQLPLGWVQTGIFNFFSSSSGTSRRGESPQYCSTTFPYYSLLLSADTPCPSDYHFISCVPAEPRLVQGRGRRELS